MDILPQDTDNHNTPTEDLTESLPVASKRFKFTVSKALRRRRKESGYSLSELARLSGVTRAYLHLLEKGENSPTLDILTKIADAFGIPLPIFLFEISEWSEFSEDELRLIRAYRRGDVSALLAMVSDLVKQQERQGRDLE